MSKTALLRFPTEDEKKETVAAAAKRRRSLNSYVLGLIHKDVQRLKEQENSPATVAVDSSPPQTEAGQRR